MRSKYFSNYLLKMSNKKNRTGYKLVVVMLTLVKEVIHREQSEFKVLL